MAKTIEYKNMYVSVTPYEYEGQKFDTLSVTVKYLRGKGFYVYYHAGWENEFGWGCIMMGGSSPLSSTQWVLVKEAPRNSAKEIEKMAASLEQAKDAISYLFDRREWEKLNTALKNIAQFGYSDKYKQQMADYKAQCDAHKDAAAKPEPSPMMRQFNDLKSKHPDALLLFRCGDFYESYEGDAKVCSQVLGITLTKSTKTGIQMAGFPYHALDTYLPKLIRAGHRVAICDQLDPDKTKRGITEMITPGANENDNNSTTQNNETMATKNMTNESANTVNNAIKVAPASKPMTAEEWKEDEVKEVKEVKDITPVVTKPAADKPKVTLKRKNAQPKADEQVSDLPKVTLVTYTTKRGEQAPRIIGFAGKDDPRWSPQYDASVAAAKAYKEAKAKDPKAKPTGNPFGPYCSHNIDGTCTCAFNFGVRYMDVAKNLVEAYNTADREAWKRAEQAVLNHKDGISNEWKAKKEAQREARKAAKSVTATTATTATQGYSAQDVAALLQKVISGGDIPKDIEALMSKAA